MFALPKPLYIDVPVTLSNVKVVFSVDSLVFEGDRLAFMLHRQLIKTGVDA